MAKRYGLSTCRLLNAGVNNRFAEAYFLGLGTEGQQQLQNNDFSKLVVAAQVLAALLED